MLSQSVVNSVIDILYYLSDMVLSMFYFMQKVILAVCYEAITM